MANASLSIQIPPDQAPAMPSAEKVDVTGTRMDIPLNRLLVAVENVRKHRAEEAEDALLRASVTSKGLLKNLVVRTARPDDIAAAAKGKSKRGKKTPANGSAGPEPTHAVVAGGRRLAALQAMAADGVIPTDTPVPCLVRDAREELVSVSYAENVGRAGMSMPDHIRAYGNMLEAGKRTAEIAAELQVSERIAARMARLAALAPQVLAAFEKDDIDYDCLKAFTRVANNHTEQRRVLKAVLEAGGHGWQQRRIIDDLTGSERMTGGNGLAQFVTLEAYEEAGGTFAPDLFTQHEDDMIQIEQPELVLKLADELLEAAAAKVTGEWTRVIPHRTWNWREQEKYHFLKKQPAAPGQADQNKLAAIATARKALEESIRTNGYSQGNWEERQKLDQQEGKIQARLTNQGSYPPEIRKLCSVVVSPAKRARHCNVAYGAIEKTDKAALTALRALVREDEALRHCLPRELERLVARTVRKGPSGGTSSVPYRMSAKLVRSLEVKRNDVVQRHLSGHFDHAFDLFVFHNASVLYEPGGHRFGRGPIEIRVERAGTTAHATGYVPPLGATDDDSDDDGPEEPEGFSRHVPDNLRHVGPILERVFREPGEFEDDEDEEGLAAFRRFQQLTTEEKQLVFGAIVACSLKPQASFSSSAHGSVEQVVQDMNIGFSDEIRPEGESFWAKISRAAILEIAGEVLGTEWVQLRLKARKAELVADVSAAFGTEPVVDQPGLTEEGRARALQWTLPGMASSAVAHTPA